MGGLLHPEIMPVPGTSPASLDKARLENYLRDILQDPDLPESKKQVISPGSLPNAMTIQKMKAGQRSGRNPILVEVLRDYGYVDARGMGIRTKVIPLMKQHVGQEPLFEATDDFVKTILTGIKKQNEPENAPINRKISDRESSKVHNARKDADKNAPLTDLQMQIMNLVGRTPTISYDDLVARTAKDRSTIMRNIGKLKMRGLLRQVGSKKTGQWEL